MLCQISMVNAQSSSFERHVISLYIFGVPCHLFCPCWQFCIIIFFYKKEHLGFELKTFNIECCILTTEPQFCFVNILQA